MILNSFKHTQILFQIAAVLLTTTDTVPKIPPKRLYSPSTKQTIYYDQDPLQLSFTIQTGSTVGNHNPQTYSVGIWMMSDYPILVQK